MKFVRKKTLDGAQDFFFHFCKVGSGPIPKMHEVLNKLKLRNVRAMFGLTRFFLISK